MAHKFKKPKKVGRGLPPKRANMHDKMVWYARQINSQAQLDKIIAEVKDPKIVAAWLAEMRPYLKFQPTQFEPQSPVQ